MNEIEELMRHPSPGGRPQPLAYRDKTLWIGSWDTDHLYAVDPRSWKVLESVQAPGRPYGMAVVGDEIRAVVSIGADDDRFFYNFIPGKGFDEASKTPCPDFTGSHLAFDGTTLYMTQLGRQRILAFDKNGAILREIALPVRCGGIGIRDGKFYMIAADAEFEDLSLASLDVSVATPQATTIASLPSDARGLVSDGSAWWTSLREVSEILSFQT